MDKRFIKGEGLEVFTGTELLWKGALEAGVSLLTGYPGSPVADFFNVSRDIQNILKEKGIIFQIANNEALAAARLNGSQMADVRGMTVMKSVGFHVASDGLALGNLSKSGHRGGALVVVGDDPWSESTQVPTDSRFLARHLHMPVMEPSTFQELKDWVNVALDLSQKSDLYILYLVTTNQADGGGTVHVSPNVYPAVNALHPLALESRTIPVEDTVILSPRTAKKEETLEKRFSELLFHARQTQVNAIYHSESGRRKVGFVASGLAFCYLEQALDQLGLSGSFPVLKLGITFPVDPVMVKDFARRVDEVVVVEEKRSFIEDQVMSILNEAYQAGEFNHFIPVWGKHFPEGLKGFPETRGLNTSVLIEKLAPLLKLVRDQGVKLDESLLSREVSLIEKTASFKISIPQRTPTFCPGCPHRDSSSVFLELKKKFLEPVYMQRKHRMKPVDLIFHGDTGCYTMLMFEPNQELMHNYSGMGLGGGTGAGINPFITNKQIVFMGDSTFFHSGVVAISDAIKNSQDITFMILDNGTIAMTGHQPTPNSSCDAMGEPTVIQDIAAVAEGLAVHAGVKVRRVNPAYRESYRELLEETILAGGVKIIIADKECGITFDRKVVREEKRTMKDLGYLPQKKYVNVTPEVCEYCLECTKMTGCPGLAVVDTHYGLKVVTDLSSCKSDGACAKVKACPSFEELTVIRKNPVKSKMELIDARQIPAPKTRSFDSHWYAYLAGVGGMGIGTVTAILVRAGLRQGYQVRFADKKGLAIRNGGVYSHLIYSWKPSYISPVIPYGKADLLLGLDILESVRSVDCTVNIRIGSPDRTSAVINTHKTSTLAGLTGKEDFTPRELENFIRQCTIRENYFGMDISEISERLLGNKLYANIIILGMAYQKGLLPLELEHVEWGIKLSVKADDLQENMQAFNLGRKIALNPGSFAQDDRFETYESLLQDKTGLLRAEWLGGSKLADSYESLVRETVRMLHLDESMNTQFALRVYDLVRHSGLAYARKYVEKVKEIHLKDSREYGWAATQAVIFYLHKVMLIKDEIYVSYLLTSAEKIRRDRERYNVRPENGDRVVYEHINRPAFTVLGKNFEFDLRTRNWQLRLMKHMKFLRKLLPEWHQKEKDFRDWYVGLIDAFNYSDRATYLAYTEALRMPEEVRGYREIRYPKMDEARKAAQVLLSQEEIISRRENLAKSSSSDILNFKK